jgi:hypothetical protein
MRETFHAFYFLWYLHFNFNVSRKWMNEWMNEEKGCKPVNAKNAITTNILNLLTLTTPQLLLPI